MASISTDGAPSKQRAQAFVPIAKWGKRVYIYNNVPYILDLEFGTSAKAPSGMTRTVVAKWKQIGEDAARRAKK